MRGGCFTIEFQENLIILLRNILLDTDKSTKNAAVCIGITLLLKHELDA